MEKIDLTIDLSNKITQKEIIDKFINVLQLTPMTNANWDGFSDYIRSLDTESELIKNKNIKSVNLIVSNLSDGPNRNTLLDVLQNATDKSQRHDDIVFNFLVN